MIVLGTTIHEFLGATARGRRKKLVDPRAKHEDDEQRSV
jgi:hypothetical protein